ncbi:hypothetical protein GCM10009839_54080 [Catenulispora yoronensis]|uniref:Uncharacterized protein n=1 Tax=Catenulispora yoronensis TaxID=450799 RepID=A0ABN2UUB5_9ACTN
MAIEDGWVLAEHARRRQAADGSVDWAGTLAAYNAVRPEHCRRVVTTSRAWGRLWHHDRIEREPEMFVPVPLGSVELDPAVIGA